MNLSILTIMVIVGVMAVLKSLLSGKVNEGIATLIVVAVLFYFCKDINNFNKLGEGIYVNAIKIMESIDLEK